MTTKRWVVYGFAEKREGMRTRKAISKEHFKSEQQAFAYLISKIFELKEYRVSAVLVELKEEYVLRPILRGRKVLFRTVEDAKGWWE